MEKICAEDLDNVQVSLKINTTVNRNNNEQFENILFIWSASLPILIHFRAGD